MNVCSMNLIRTVNYVASLPFTRPHGILKCSSYAHFRIAKEVAYTFMSIVNSDILIFSVFHMLYSRVVCDFECNHNPCSTAGMATSECLSIGKDGVVTASTIREKLGHANQPILEHLVYTNKLAYLCVYPGALLYDL